MTLNQIDNPELSFEISECDIPLDEIIQYVQTKYPGFRFNRTEARYESCLMAIFTTT